MKILLVGDYSGVHSELAKALKMLDHHVVVMSDGDGYKNFQRDLDLKTNNGHNSEKKKSNPKAGLPWIKKLVQKAKHSLFFHLLRIAREFSGLKGIFFYISVRKNLKELKNFDVVQIINPMAIESFGSLANLMLLQNLRRNNKSLFLCALGDDLAWVNACLNKKFKYSPLDNLNKINFYLYSYSLRYKYGLFFQKLNRYCITQSDKIIPGLYDYKKAYSKNEKCTVVTPLPISEDSFLEPKKTNYPIKIFHGWQNGKESRKGNLLFHEAATKIEEELGKDIVEYTVVKSLPFEEYKKLFKDADILMDQCFSYDRGVNAVLGMCSGKVVFSGFDSDSLMESDKVLGVNSGQTSESIYLQLKNLIENPRVMDEIKINAFHYAAKYHESRSVAEKYLAIWTNSQQSN